MPEPAAASAAHPASSFARVLAALTAPAPEPFAPLEEEAFAGDIATLSYEQALRNHARHHPVDADIPPRAERIETAPDAYTEKPLRPSRKENRKSASITIRVNRAESAQLRARAAEAGLTVSSYLRSCILEVESLRVQVKEALAQLHPASSTGAQAPASPAPLSPTEWRFRLFPRWTERHRASPA